MAGRRAAMAPHFHVDLPGNRAVVRLLRDLQRKLQAAVIRPARYSRRLADGAPLLLLRPQAARQGSLQPAAEASVHRCDWIRRAVGTHRFRHMETGTVLVAGVDDGRVPSGAAMALRNYVGDAGIRVWASGDGSAAWLE